MPTVLALDVGVATGYCFSGDSKPGTLSNTEDKYTIQTLDNLCTWFSILMRSRKPDLIVMEGYSFGSKDGRELSGERGGIIRLLAHRGKVRILFIPPQRLKKYAIGTQSKGEDSKQSIRVKAALEYGDICRNDHESDAWYLCHLGERYLSHELTGVSNRDSVLSDLWAEDRKAQEALDEIRRIAEEKQRKADDLAASRAEAKRLKELARANNPRRRTTAKG